jgi:hypothetical protein
MSHHSGGSSVLFETISSVPQVINKFFPARQLDDAGASSKKNDDETRKQEGNGSAGSNNTIQSSFPRLWKFSDETKYPIPCPLDWLAGE